MPKTCSEMLSSAFHWSLSGFSSGDIDNPDVRNQPELTAIMRVGDSKVLSVRAGSTATAEDCSAKAGSVEWLVSNDVVARLEAGESPRAASLIALQPGDTNVSAILKFEDGTPDLRALPWSFTNVGSGNITVIRVIP